MTSHKPTTIYALCHPITNEIRYVGKSVDPKKRLVSHCSDTKRKNNHCTNWVRSILPLKPVMLELEVTMEWVQAEQFWITYFKFLGATLTNHTIGGEGACGITHTNRDETKVKISNALMGNKNGVGNRSKTGVEPWNKGNKTYVRPRKGNYPWNKGMKLGPHPTEFKELLSQKMKEFWRAKNERR